LKETIKSIIIYSVACLTIVLSSCYYNNSQKGKLLKTMENTLYNYFANNNIHISSRDFSIDDVKIRCIGNKAYIVEFDLLISDDNSKNFNKLGATIYKENDEWNVKGFGRGLTNEELNLYNFKCYN